MFDRKWGKLTQTVRSYSIVFSIARSKGFRTLPFNRVRYINMDSIGAVNHHF